MHSFQLNFVGGDQQFAGLHTRHAMIAAKIIGRPRAFLAELCLETAGLVIDAGMDDAAVVPGLVPGWCRLLFQ